MKIKNYDTFGVMIDMSRNAVMSVEALKKYLPYLAKMGYNCVMLYTEDTYEVEGEPFFGYMRGRYTKDELRELDAYADSLGIELIPCIQSLAHYTAFVHWNKVPVDIDDTLMVGDERTYEFIENTIASVRKCFKTNRIHVGMDEAWKLGRGKYHNKNGCESATSIMEKHLARVNEIVKKYDFEPMIWSDMFFRSFNNNQYYIPKIDMPREVVESLPENVIPVYWDYYQMDPQVYDDMLYNHEQLSDKTWFAGGAWTWVGFTPANRFSIDTMRLALDACRKHKVKNVFFTMWGDNGAECSRYAVMPTLLYLAEYANGNRDEEKIKAKFKRIFGAEYDDFMALDDMNTAFGVYQKERSPGEKMALYSDLFNGFMDVDLREEFEEKFAALAVKYAESAKKYRKWSYLFDSAAKLAEALSVKYTLGLRTRKAYQAGDKAELLRLANEAYAPLYKMVDRFARAFEKQWFAENKTCGFDVQDIRLGGVMRRIDACRRRLVAYAKGEIDRIEELEAELIPLDGYKPTHRYREMVTANVL